MVHSRDVTHLAVFEPTVAGAASIAGDGTVTKNRSVELNVLVRYLNRQVPVTLAFLPARREFRWDDLPLENPVDRHLYPQFHSLRLTPSPLADDSMFLRRAYLDAIGVLPTLDEAQSILGRSNGRQTRTFDRRTAKAVGVRGFLGAKVVRPVAQ